MSIYTPEITKRIVDEYKADSSRATVDRLAAELDVSPRSIIAKLSNEQVYIPPVRTSKTGEAIVRKEDLAKEIGEMFGIEVPTLVKAGKLELRALYNALKDPLNLRALLVDLEDDN